MQVVIGGRVLDMDAVAALTLIGWGMASHHIVTKPAAPTVTKDRAGSAPQPKRKQAKRKHPAVKRIETKS